MNKIFLVALAALLGLTAATFAVAAEQSVYLGDKAPTAFDSPQAVGTKATCPVTGDTFTISAQTAHSEYQGKHYYFCCPACKPQFDADPAKYVKPAK